MWAGVAGGWRPAATCAGLGVLLHSFCGRRHTNHVPEKSGKKRNFHSHSLGVRHSPKLLKICQIAAAEDYGEMLLFSTTEILGEMKNVYAKYTYEMMTIQSWTQMLTGFLMIFLFFFCNRLH